MATNTCINPSATCVSSHWASARRTKYVLARSSHYSNQSAITPRYSNIYMNSNGKSIKSTRIGGRSNAFTNVNVNAALVDTAKQPPQNSTGSLARVVVVTEETALSPFKYPEGVKPMFEEAGATLSPPWAEVVDHMAMKLSWVNPGYNLSVITREQVEREGWEVLQSVTDSADMLVLLGVHDSDFLTSLATLTSHVPSFVPLDSHPELSTALTRLQFQPRGALQQAARVLPFSRAAQDAAVISTVEELFGRGNPNDFLFLLLVLIDAAITPEPQAQPNPTDLGVIWCMLRNCKDEVLGCVQDPECKAGLDCLEECGLNDQVCSYQCIVSHESNLFSKFSLCVLQKNNCLRNSATRPELPEVRPMTTFRGSALTAEVAEALFVGWMEPDNPILPALQNRGGGAAQLQGVEPFQWSWKVVGGQNPAYDYFPCQHQIFYPGKNGRSFWYDPVFQVETLSGEKVWRRRHYGVKRAQEPGSFLFKVLDNGVISEEFWRVVAVEDNLEWAVFYYAGAATAAGQAYSGAVFCTPDGLWPARKHWEDVKDALEICGIKLWELYQVDNSNCDGAPLGLLD